MSGPHLPKPGDLVALDGRASPQFGGNRALLLRIASVANALTTDDWVWLTGYVIDALGDAVAKREVFVHRAGIRPAPPPLTRAARKTARAKGTSRV
ncbi:hypothetical protein GA0070618_3405 [Micromonospora echinospora]|uniref:Uncharacterized protein n=1 Tax=Micromonospora echinospora TaxID=1877 RepID=A0A1C4XWM0_MICEC|nr:hypothetical protein [Micromonospora echinospora]SCF12865.1 hypothetical protein GA0070618_3405 [Micromonospora echinospora]